MLNDAQSIAKRRKGTFLEKFVTSDPFERKNLADVYLEKDGSYFFDRNPVFFGEVLDFCRTGELHIPNNACPHQFLQELRFWKVSAKYLASCCYSEIFSNNPDTDNEPHDRNQAHGPPLVTSIVSHPTDKFFGACLSKPRRVAWRCLEDPNSSTAARVLSGISILFIFLSVLGLVAGSLPQCQTKEGAPVVLLVHMEQACVAWFTLEYMARLAVCPERWTFVRSPFNIIDLLSIAPFYIELVFTLCGLQPERLATVKGAFLAVRLLRVVKVARVLKLARYSSNMQGFGAGLKNSKAEFAMLGISMSVSILVFSTTIYYIEKGAESTPFTTIPASIWFCIITMTTVGYGDMVPTTDFGKFVASFTTVSGVIVLAYPITLIVGKFNASYHQYGKHGEASEVCGSCSKKFGEPDPYLEAQRLSILSDSIRI